MPRSIWRNLLVALLVVAALLTPTAAATGASLAGEAPAGSCASEAHEELRPGRPGRGPLTT